MTDIMNLSRNGAFESLYKIHRSIKNFEGYGTPVLYLEGDKGGMSKDVSVSMAYIYGERSGVCTIKWQGSSSIDFPKKNYTITFDSPFEVVSGWGEQRKYCLKANFVDPSHARNLMCAKLWGQVVKSRTPANATLNALPNGGAVDGFPVIISLNGEFHGLYTWNIPKDGWMFGMVGTDAQQAILCADTDTNGAVRFQAIADFQNDFDLEYSSDGQSDWVLSSVNKLLAAVKDSDGSNIHTKIAYYLDWDSAIDYYIFTVLTTGYDGVARNYILATYDGVKWFFSAYDMDTTFGAASLGKYFIKPNANPSFKSYASANKLFDLIWTFLRPQLRERYAAIRKEVMSEINLATEFSNFASKIPLPVLVSDVELYPRIPSSLSSNTEQILNFYRLRVQLADVWIADTDGEEEIPVGLVNLVATSIDTNGAIYNGGLGYKNDVRLSSSSGAESTLSGAAVSGFIPFEYGKVIRMVGATGAVNAPGMYLAFYDSNFTKVAVQYLNAICVEPHGAYTLRSDGLYEAKVDTSTFASGIMYDNMIASSYIRVSLNPCEGGNMIVTYDQEIPDEG